MIAGEGKNKAVTTLLYRLTSEAMSLYPVIGKRRYIFLSGSGNVELLHFLMQDSCSAGTFNRNTACLSTTPPFFKVLKERIYSSCSKLNNGRYHIKISLHVITGTIWLRTRVICGEGHLLNQDHDKKEDGSAG